MNESLGFEQHVIDSLARLETNMNSLTGPEGRVNRLETIVTRLVIGGVILAVLVLGPAAAMVFLK